MLSKVQIYVNEFIQHIIFAVVFFLFAIPHANAQTTQPSVLPDIDGGVQTSLDGGIGVLAESLDIRETRRIKGIQIRQSLANLCPLGERTTLRHECRCTSPNPWPNSSCNETCLLSIEPGYVIEGNPDFQTRGDHGQSNFNNVARDSYIQSTQSKIEQYNSSISGLATIVSAVAGSDTRPSTGAKDDKLTIALNSESSRSLHVESKNAAIEINVQARGYVTGWPFRNHRGWEHAVVSVTVKCMFHPTPQLVEWLDEVSPIKPK